MSLFFFFSSRRRHTRFDCDWSSDVCSSDLGVQTSRPSRTSAQPRSTQRVVEAGGGWCRVLKIGRASCRERVEISVVAVSLKKKTPNPYWHRRQCHIEEPSLSHDDLNARNKL